MLLSAPVAQAKRTTANEAGAPSTPHHLRGGQKAKGVLQTQLATYCNTGLGGGTCDITQVQITGTTFNTTASLCPGTSSNNYSLYAPSTGAGNTATLLRGTTYFMGVTTSVSDIVSLWIDYNQDGLFDATEWTQVTTASTIGVASTVSFVVPTTALTGVTGLRIRSRVASAPNAATDACSLFGSGETRDYAVTIGAGAVSYCNTNLGGGTCDITQLQIGGTTFNTTASLCPGTSSNNYSLYAPSTASGTTGTLLRGTTYSMAVTTSVSDIISLWIDYNQDGLFDATEWTQIATASTSSAASFTVPTTALTGTTGLRIRTRVAGAPNAATDACTVFGSGETRDYTVTIGATAASTCFTGLGGGACDITQIQITGTTFNTTASLCPGDATNNYSSYAPATTNTATLVRNSTYTIGVTASANDIISLWIDYNQNGLFDATDWTQVTTSSVIGTAASATFTVPATAILGTVGLRIRTRAAGNPNAATDACTVFGSGETRDYTVTIGATAASTDDPSPYCAPTSSVGCGNGNITNVTLVGTTLNNSSTCAVTTGGYPYANYPATGSTTATVLRGTTYPISVTTTDNSTIISVWADWNNNLTFEASEWVQVATASTIGVAATANLTVPTTAVSGPVRLRVRSRASGSANGSPDACTTFASGEAEDYTITVGCPTAPAAPTATGASRCGSGSVVLTASGTPTGGTYRWYTVATGGTSIAGATAATYTTPVLSATTTYYVSTVTSAGCESTTRASAVATINALPVATLTAGGPVGFCPGGSVTLTAGGGTTGATYQFTLGGGALGAVTTTPTLTVSTGGSYGVIVTNPGLGCAASSNTVAVTVYPAAVANVGTAPTFCSGASATLGGTAIAGYTYQWSPATGLSSATVSNPTITLTNTTGAPISSIYTLSVTTAQGCSATNSVIVTVNPAAVANAGTAPTFCSGGSATLGAAAVAGYTYRWSPATGLSSSTVSNPTVALTNTTGAPVSITYTLTATTSQGCPATSTVVVTVYPAAVANVGTAPTFCSGGSATLGGAATLGTTYQWTPATGLSSATVSNPTVTLTNTTGAPISTTYSLTATTAQGCFATNTVVVTVNPAAVANAGTAPTFCSGGSATLGAAAITGTTYRWTPTTGLSSATVSNPTVTLTNTTGAPLAITYTLTATTAQGCPATSTVVVTVNQAAVANAGVARSFCSGGTATLGTAAITGTTYQWTPATGLSSATVSNPTITLTNTTSAPISTTYSLTATTAQGCSATSTVVVTVNQAAVANAGTAPTFCSGGSAPLGTAAIAGTTYRWTPTTGLSDATVSNPTVTLTNTTGAPISNTYTLTATTTQGCSATSTVVVTVNQAAVANAGTAPTFCSGSSVTLGAAAVTGTTYQWTPATGLSSATVSNPTVTLTNTTSAPISTTYTLTATTAQGCSATSTVVVTVNQAAIANAGTAPTFCSGGSAPLGAAAITGTTYRWAPATGLSSATVSNPTVTLTNTTSAPISTTYTLTATTTQGCSATSTVIVTVNQAAVADAGPAPAPICVGNSATLGVAAIAGTTYQWSPATDLSSATVSNPTVSPTAAGAITYTLTATTAQGCSATSNVTVTANAAAVATAGTDQTFCSGGTATLGAAAIAGTTYLWTPATGLSDATVSNPTVTLTNTTSAPISTTYTLTATTTQGCSATGTVVVTVNQAAVADAGTAPAPICVGSSATLGVAAITGTTYQWSPATDLSDATVSNPTVSPTAAGAITYTLTATTAQGCSATSTVIVTANPAAVATAGPAQTLCLGGSATLGVAAITGTTYLWSPATDLSDATVSNPMVTPTAAGAVTYTLTATTALGCSATSTVTVTANPVAVATAGADQAFCSGGTATLGAAATTGTTYQWSPATGLSSATASNPSITLTNSGATALVVRYVVTATTALGCSATDTVQVTVNPTPATPTITRTGTTLTSSSTTGNQWLLGGGTILGATGTTYVPAGPGTYTVVVTNATGCVSSASLPLVITGTRAGVNVSQLTLYPNPTTKNELTLSLPGVTGAAELSVFNAVGQKMMSEQPLTLHNQPVLLQLPTLATGVYIVQLRMLDGTVYTRRLIRE